MTENEFNDIYQQLYPKVYRLCLGYVTGDVDTARELAQTTFIKVWNHRDTFKGNSTISTWIYRIAVNSCLSHLKKKKPLRLDSYPQMMEQAADQEKESHDIQQLYHCIDQLKKINKTVVLMELEQIPQEDIANTLGYSHGSIRTRLSRIREALLKCMTHGK